MIRARAGRNNTIIGARRLIFLPNKESAELEI
jgi:hypothetical protein